MPFQSAAALDEAYLIAAPASTDILSSQLLAVGLTDQAQIDGEVEAAAQTIDPIQITLSTVEQGDGYAHARFVVSGGDDHLQLWAKDTEDHWYNIVETGWGPMSGFAVPPVLPPVTTSIYPVSDNAREYNLTVDLIDLGNENDVIATASGVLNVKTNSQDFILPQDFGVWQEPESGVNGYSVGFKLLTTNASQIQQFIVQLFKGDVLLATATSSKIQEQYPTASELSAPFDVDGTFNYDSDGAWTYSSWNGTILDIPTKAVISALDSSNNTYVVENTNLTGNTALLDVKPPVIELNDSQVVYVNVGEFFNDPGATWTDNVDGAGLADIYGEIDYFVLGSYTLTYKKTDSAGNEAAPVTRTVIIQEAPIQYKIDTIFSERGGVIEPIGPVLVNEGASQLFNITVDSGFAISSVLIDGLPVATSTTYTFTNVTGNHSIEVIFSELPRLDSIYILPIDPIIIVGEQQQFTATTYDQFDNPLQASISWTSTDELVGTIDSESGLFVANQPGTTDIVATDGMFNTFTTVTVLEPPPLSLDSLSISPTTASTNVGESRQFTAVALDQNGNPFPTDIIWSSSNDAIATVTSTGVATGVSAGTVVITASSSSMLATSTLTVNAPVVPTSPSGGGGGGGGGGGLVYPASIPSSITAVNVPLIISPTQNGEMIMNLGENVVQLGVDNGAVNGITTFNATLGTLAPNQLPNSSLGAFLVGGQVFNITASNQFGNVTSFNDDLEITLTIPNLPDQNDMGVYYFNTAANRWELISSSYDPATHKFTFTVNHLTLFAVFQTVGKPVSLKTSFTGLVLGQKVYDDGTLLRSITTKKVYIIFQGKKLAVSSSNLRKYSGKSIIDVSESTVAPIQNSPLVIVNYVNGTLLRTPNKKIYVVQNSIPKHIVSLEEFKRDHKGKSVIQVDSNFNRFIAKKSS